MAAPPSTLALVARHLSLALDPVREAFRTLDNFRIFAHRLGWAVDSLPAEYENLARLADEAIGAAQAVSAGAPTPEQIQTLLTKINEFYAAAQQITAVPSGAVAADFLKEIGEGLFELLLVEYLSDEVPRLHNALELLGVITNDFHPSTPLRPAYTQTRFHFKEIPRIIADPGSIPGRVYGWGTPELDFPLLVSHLAEVLVALGIPVGIVRPTEELAEGYMRHAAMAAKGIDLALAIPIADVPLADGYAILSLLMVELPGDGSRPPGFILQPDIPAELAGEIHLTENLQLNLSAKNNLQDVFGVCVRPGEVTVRRPLSSDTEPVELEFQAELLRGRVEPILLLGDPNGARLSYYGWRVQLETAWVSHEPEAVLRLILDGLILVLETREMDGFLGALLGGEPVFVPINLGFALSNRTGLSFIGVTGFTVKRAPNLYLGRGSVLLEEIELGLVGRMEDPPKLELHTRLSLSGDFKAVSFSVQQAGFFATLRFDRGNAGPFDVALGYLPPKGAGLSIKGQAVRGGGFLDIDQEEGRYSGALQLEIGSTAVQAVGLIETKLPQGGWAFVGLVSAQFSPRPLGFGFTLNGIGGILALHRSISVEEIRRGIEDQSINRVMFPENPGQAGPIIATLDRFFPLEPGRFVAAPMALIGWGRPTVAEIRLALIVSMPLPVVVAIAGLIDICLPDQKAPLIQIRIRFLGTVDFAARRFALYGELYDSRLGVFSLSGAMAVRACWGGTPSFALAIGGFHPRFAPPEGFPVLERITLSLGTGNPSLVMQSYLAITSNTVQFGARSELRVEALGFVAHGWLGYDVLAKLSPFSLEASLSGCISLSRDERTLAAIHLDAMLTGPAPWHAWGEASVSLLLTDVKVSFDLKLGSGPPAPPAPVDPWPQLRDAMQDARSWRPEWPAGTQSYVTIGPASGDQVLFDPGAGLALHQSVLPLNRTISRFGTAVPAGPSEYRISGVRVAGKDLPAWESSIDLFAPGQFLNLTDDERLTLPSYEPMDAGISLASDAMTFGKERTLETLYQTCVVETPWQSTASVTVEPSPQTRRPRPRPARGSQPQVRLRTSLFRVVDRARPLPVCLIWRVAPEAQCKSG